MPITLLLFLLSAVTIYLACEYFVNGIEWTGHHLKLSQSATGSLLAALGTALPECIVTLSALLMGDAPAQQQIGIGAALGGPLVLSTLGYAAVGLTLLLCLSPEQRVIEEAVQRETGRDQLWFCRHLPGGGGARHGELRRQGLAGAAVRADLSGLCAA